MGNIEQCNPFIALDVFQEALPLFGRFENKILQRFNIGWKISRWGSISKSARLYLYNEQMIFIDY